MDNSIATVTEANRTSWNRIAGERAGEPAEFFRDGGVCLEGFERELAGDVAGRRVLQLACSHGDEVLSWSNLGARAVGVDISDVAIDVAVAKAERAGIDADFRRADMFDLPSDLVDLDMIYLSWGVICWAPDVTGFARMVAQRLRPGGFVLMADHHPVWEVLAVRGQNHLAVAGNYFGRGTPRSEQDDAKRPIGARGVPHPPPFSAFVWPCADVVMAFVSAGLRLDAFVEAAEPAIYHGLGENASSLPAYYVIKATRP